MKRGLTGAALCMSAALFLNGTAENAAAQGAKIAAANGWSVNGVLNPAALKAAGNKPIMLVFR